MTFILPFPDEHNIEREKTVSTISMIVAMHEIEKKE